MRSLDDELRSLLTTRADDVGPGPVEAFARVEQRARGLRRRRIALAGGAAVVAVALVGVGITAVTDSDLLAGPSTGSYAGGGPTEERSSSALDPAHPWSYRGEPSLVTQQELDVYQAEYDARHPEGASFSPLFGQVYEPSRIGEVVFVARFADGTANWGVVRGSESGPEFVLDERLPADPTALVAALPGDEQARLLVVAEPTAAGASYLPDGVRSVPMYALADGVWTTGLDGDQARDRVSVTDARGRVTYSATAPDTASSVTPPATGGTPGNVLSDWPQRGTMPPGLLEESVAAYATSRSAPVTNVDTAVLFAGGDDAGKRYLLAQMWVRGDTVADTVGYVTRAAGGGEPELQLKSRLAFDASVVAMVVSPGTGQTTETLVVVPRPGTGQVLYAADGTTFRPVGQGQDNLDGVVLVDRQPDAQRDRLRLLDGDGRQFFDDAVFNLLCGVKECG